MQHRDINLINYHNAKCLFCIYLTDFLNDKPEQHQRARSIIMVVKARAFLI